jgi:hypothetical protein
MTVIVELPVPYEAVVREFRKHYTHPATFLASVPIGIREASAAEAPLALRATTPDGRVHDYRRHGEGLLRTLWLETEAGWEVATPENADRLLRGFVALARDRGAVHDRTAWPFLRRAIHTRRISRPEEHQEVRSDEKAETLREWRSAMAGARCVDGTILVPSRGPCWLARAVVTVDKALREPTPLERQARDGGLPRGARFAVRLEVREELGQVEVRYPHTDPEWCFGPGELQIAETRMRADKYGLMRSVGLPDSRFSILPSAGSVIGPELARADPLGVPELDAAAKGVLTAAAAKLADMSPEAIRLYADLKAIVGKGVEADVAGDAIGALQEFHLAWREWLRGDKGLHPFEREVEDPAAPLLSRLEGGHEETGREASAPAP